MGDDKPDLDAATERVFQLINRIASKPELRQELQDEWVLLVRRVRELEAGYHTRHCAMCRAPGICAGLREA